MSWSIFGRLFWKVWREDWKRWASVLAVGVGVIYIAQVVNRNPAVGIIPIPIVYIITTIAAVRGKRDNLNGETTTIYSKLPSIFLITVWACCYALIFTACISELHTGSLAYTTAFMVTWFVCAGMLGYSFGIWSHPWFPAMITTLPFIAAFLDYVSRLNNPLYQPSQI